MDFQTFENVAKTALDLLPIAYSVFGSKKRNQEMSVEDKTTILLRELIQECRENLAVIDMVKVEALKDDWLKAVKSIAPLLKNDVSRLIILGKDGCSERIMLIQEDIERLEEFNKQGSEDEDDKEEYINPKTIKEAIIFCATKIEFLKNCANISEDRVFSAVAIFSSGRQKSPHFILPICLSHSDGKCKHKYI